MKLFEKKRYTWVKGQEIDKKISGMDPTQQEMLCYTISSPMERVHIRRIHTGTHYKVSIIICQIKTRP